MSIVHSANEARAIRNDMGGQAHSKLADTAGAYVGSKLEDKKKSPGRNKKKKDLKTGDSGFRRSLLDEPPNVELMAKFAAEKER